MATRSTGEDEYKPNRIEEELDRSQVRLTRLAKFMGRGALAIAGLVVGTAYSASQHGGNLVKRASRAYLKDEYGIDADEES